MTLRSGYDPGRRAARRRCWPSDGAGWAASPRGRSTFDQHLPHTSSGKVMRRLLKARELGLPEGDLSTLEQR